MNLLAQLVCSRVRAEILRLLFGGDRARLHLRELERRSGLAVTTLRQDLRKLVALDLVREEKDGNRTCFSANRDHPLYPDLRSLVARTVGIVEVLRQGLGTEGIAVAFVFGSVARGEEKAGSDVDLLVIGSVGLRELSRRLGGVGGQIGREINPHAMTPAEFRRRLEDGEHFVTAVMAAEKLFLAGGPDELAAVGQ
ncbi:MAG: toxin-antitoxin system toxin subunit [Lentisphaerae bacterium]|nr:toxin-antitoxin system toxin subunit [Lentisphaerota bacterium]